MRCITFYTKTLKDRKMFIDSLADLGDPTCDLVRQNQLITIHSKEARGGQPVDLSITRKCR